MSPIPFVDPYPSLSEASLGCLLTCSSQSLSWFRGLRPVPVEDPLAHKKRPEGGNPALSKSSRGKGERSLELDALATAPLPCTVPLRAWEEVLKPRGGRAGGIGGASGAGARRGNAPQP